MVNINIKFTNRWLYTFIAILIVVSLGVIVYAIVPNPGHGWSEIEKSIQRVDASPTSSSPCANGPSDIDSQVSCPAGTVLIDCGVKNSDNDRRFTDGSFFYGSVSNVLVWLTERDAETHTCYFRIGGSGHAQCSQSWVLSAYCLG